MPYIAALSTSADTSQAAREVCEQAKLAGDTPPDLAVVFFSPHHAADAEGLLKGVHDSVRPRCLLGCVGESIVGNDREIEQEPALSLWLARWERLIEMAPFHLVVEPTSEGHSILGWPDRLASVDPARACLLVLGDPFSFPVDDFLREVNENQAGLRVMGGMASGIRGPGESRLLIDGRVVKEGAVGVLLQGEIGIRSVVSQGCRPIGRHLVVTKRGPQENVIAEVSGKTPLAYLQQLWPELTPRDQQLLQRGLHVGRVINEYQGEFQRGDFLVRNVMGLDRDTGAMAITDRVRVGQTVQFHVRDADTADEDLHALLQLDVSAHVNRPQSGLLFTCNGRGTRLFDEPNHDARVLRAEAGPIPLAGFFAQGELGPIGGQNFIHGFTASAVLFE